MIGEYLGLERHAGLTTALVGEADVNDLLQPWGDDAMYVLTSGQIPPNPSELLGSDEMKALLSRLEDVFDTVVIDAPPLLPVTDAAVLSRHVGGVVLVIGVQKLKRQELMKSLDALKLVGVSVLGLVLNRIPAKGPDAYSYSYYGGVENQESRSARGRQVAKPHSQTSESTARKTPAGVPETADLRAASVFPAKRLDG
jgi:capsular exopolysaccharide synthesis family protein